MTNRQRQRGQAIRAICALPIAAGLVIAAAPRVETQVPGPATVSVDFVGRGTAMSPQTQAGVVARAYWNSAAGAVRSTPLALVDHTGAATTAYITWTSDNVWSTGIPNTPGHNRMMQGYLDNGNGGTIRVVASGLRSATYDVYVYVDGDNGSTARTGIYQVSAPGMTTVSRTLTDAANATFGGTFRLASNSAGNYLRFTVTGTGFTLTASPGQSSGARRSPINGLQIVPASAPPPPDYAIGVTPASQSIVPGGTRTYAVTVAGANGFSGAVALSAAGLPPGVTASFTPASVTASGTSTLTLTASSAAAPGAATLTVLGTSGTLSRSATATVTVSAVPLFTISGRLGPPLLAAGRTVNLGGSVAAAATTDDEGRYSFGGLANGSYVVAPSGDGYAFTPVSRSVTVAGASISAVDFAVSVAPATYSMSGSVTSAGAAGTTLTVSGAIQRTAIADASGRWTMSELPNGTYSVTPAKPGYAFVPASRTVTVQNSSLEGVTFEALGPTAARANSYDDRWQAAWVQRARALLTAAPAKTAGFVLEIGDSITHSMAYAIWTRSGQGRTADDQAALTWARAASWGSNQVSIGNKNGWYLAAADTTGQRGMTSSGGISLPELLSGTGNGGPAMPAASDPATARQLLVATSYTGNLQIDTLAAAFADAQFAVVMLGTNDAANPANAAALATVVDVLEARNIVPILSTIPPRNDALGNDVNVQLNAAIRSLAEARALPLIDYYQEILLRRPGTTWSGTLIANDGVHPTASGGGFGLESDPYGAGGDAPQHLTGEALANVGYLLRSWLTVQKLKEVKAYVIEGINP